MKALLDAILAKCQNTANSMTGFMGVAPSGQVGPFQDMAPENIAKGGDYTVYKTQTPGRNFRGFRVGMEGYQPIIQFSVFGTDNATVIAEAEAIDTAFSRQSLTMTAGTFGGCLSQHTPYTKRAPQIGPNIREVYEGIATLKFSFQG